MDPLLGSALISGASSLLGGLFGSGAQSSANRTNLQIARETNQMQYQMFQEQNAFNERMYNQMQQYNTPAAQMQRYNDAGINPYIAAGNVQSGNAQSALQSAQPLQLHTAQVQPVDAFKDSFSQIGNVISQYAQNELALSQAQKNRAEAGWVDRLNGAQLNKMSAETNNLYQQGSLLGLDFKLKNDTLGNYIKLSDLSVLNAEKTNEQLDVITQSARLENALKNIDLGIQSKYGERMFVATLSKTLAESFATNASVRQRDAQIAIDKQNANTNAKNAQTNAAVGGAQVNNLVQQAIKTAEETTGIKIDNDTSAKIQKFVIDTYHSDAKDAANRASSSYHGARMSKMDADQYPIDKTIDRVDKIAHTVNTATQSYSNLKRGKSFGKRVYKFK
nr:MAG TPA: DNA pilot protein VP2 [Microviridae sp.]